jgi:hypothetical protein
VRALKGCTAMPAPEEPPKTNWAKGSLEWQDEQERKREAELAAAAADKS